LWGARACSAFRWRSYARRARASSGTGWRGDPSTTPLRGAVSLPPFAARMERIQIGADSRCRPLGLALPDPLHHEVMGRGTAPEGRGGGVYFDAGHRSRLQGREENARGDVASGSPALAAPPGQPLQYRLSTPAPDWALCARLLLSDSEARDR